MRVLRRFAMLCMLGWWLGGMTFYTLTVIRAARQVTGSHARVGFITQKATLALNLIGAGALAMMLVDAACTWRPARKAARIGLAGTWLVTALAHAWTFLLHARLDGMLDLAAMHVPDRPAFHGVHERYLIATTIEWFAGLGFLLCALFAWRDADAVRPDRT